MIREWTTADLRRWTGSLTLVTAPWLADVLGELGVRAGIARRRDLLAELRDQADAERAHLTDGDGARLAAIVSAALQRIAAQTSPDDAEAFQRWTRRHFICRDLPPALYTWREVLRHARRPGSGMYERIEPPPACAALVAAAAGVVADEHWQVVENRIRALAPPPTADDEEIGLDFSSEARTAIETLHREATVTALIRISGTADAEQRRAIGEWAEAQARALDLPAETLEGARLLATYPECVDGPPAILIAAAP